MIPIVQKPVVSYNDVMNPSYDLIVVGGGPAGYEAALEAGKSGLKVVLLESKNLGGTCVNVGCIPSKAYLSKAALWNEIKRFKSLPDIPEELSLASIQRQADRVILKQTRAIESGLKTAGVRWIKDQAAKIGTGQVTLGNGDKLSAKQIVLATGTQPWIPPFVGTNSLPAGVYTNETIFNLETLPKQLAIIGGGVIGVEFASFFASFGVEVSLIEAAESILPMLSSDLQKEGKQILRRHKVKLLESETVRKLSDNLELTLGDDSVIQAEAVLIAVGRRPILPECPDSLKKDQKGYILVNDKFETSLPAVYAIGDINGQSLLAHSASDQARQLIQYLVSKTLPRKRAIPMVVYTTPSLVSVQGEDSLGTEADMEQVPFGLSGRAQAEGHIEGWLKFEIRDGILSQVRMVGYHVEELLPVFTLAIQDKMDLNQLLTIIYAHPSYGELVADALRKVLG